MPAPRFPIFIELEEHEVRMLVHGLICERDALKRTAEHAVNMPHFRSYTLGKAVLVERLIERLTFAR
jgi:hypothetical protein